MSNTVHERAKSQDFAQTADRGPQSGNSSLYDALSYQELDPI